MEKIGYLILIWSVIFFKNPLEFLLFIYRLILNANIIFSIGTLNNIFEKNNLLFYINSETGYTYNKYYINQISND